MEKFNKVNLKNFRDVLTKHFKEIEEETGVKISIGNIRYDATEFSSKLNAQIINGKSKEELQKEDFEKNCVRIGLKPEEYLNEFEVYGKTFILVGVAPRKRKYTIIAKNKKDSRYYKLTIKDYLRNMSKKQIIAFYKEKNKSI
jgi:hypothetical protein